MTRIKNSNSIINKMNYKNKKTTLQTKHESHSLKTILQEENKLEKPKPELTNFE